MTGLVCSNKSELPKILKVKRNHVRVRGPEITATGHTVQFWRETGLKKTAKMDSWEPNREI